MSAHFHMEIIERFTTSTEHGLPVTVTPCHVFRDQGVEYDLKGEGRVTVDRKKRLAIGDRRYVNNAPSSLGRVNNGLIAMTTKQ